jgi:hypothetical protein
MKKLVLLAIVLAAAYFGGLESGFFPMRNGSSSGSIHQADRNLAEALENHRSNVQIQAAGRVVKVLADDNNGSRHQRFIVRTSSGQSLLVAHNIDLARRVASLRTGDPVEFSGEYEWNEQGGVIHWTHRDPQGRHASGWIKHAGHRYE